MHLRFSFLALVALTACGARSALEIDGAAAASGSGVGGGSGASSAATGAGGAEPACVPSKVTATWYGGANDGNPLLPPHLVADSEIYNSADLSFAVVPSGPGDTQVWRGGFKPWGAPADFPTGLLLYPTITTTAVDLAMGPGRIDGSHALSVAALDGMGTQVFLSVPTTSDPGPSMFFPPAGPGAARPLFIAKREMMHLDPKPEMLQGIEHDSAGKRRLKVRILSDEWGNILYDQSVACGADELAAAASGWQSEFLIAASSALPIGKCDDDNIPLGSPDEIQVSFYHQPLGQVIQPILSLKAEGHIAHLDVFPAGADPAADGAWIVFSDVAVTPGAKRHVRAARFDPAGKLLTPPFEVATTENMAPDLTAAARLGDNLAVAWGTVEGANLRIKIGIFDRSGALLRSFEIVPVSPTGVALLGSPDGQQVVAAVTEGDGQAHMVRYGCPAGP